jgi:hypothetical protein
VLGKAALAISHDAVAAHGSVSLKSIRLRLSRPIYPGSATAGRLPSTGLFIAALPVALGAFRGVTT